ncbi:hypothetical protein Pelo_16771 [Pelomyxa schiedti]|nr:hypothetical protein Pelo_16771 [Pelomyxa schiedti]
MWRSSQPATMLQFMVNATFTHWHRHPLKRVGRQFRFDPLNLLQEGAGYKELEEERCDLSHSYALSLWKLYHNEGKDAAAEKLHRRKRGRYWSHSFFLSKSRLDKEEKVQFYTHVLPCHLSPHPGANSVVRLLLQYRQLEALLHGIPQSPDLNLIEKFWDVVSSRITQLHLELLTGKYGVRRCADVDDLIFCLETTRMSRHSLHGVRHSLHGVGLD